MERMHGDVITGHIPEALDAPAERARIADELIDALAEIHAVDWQACGLEGFGKPTGYLERQLRRFGGLWEHNKTRELPMVERVGAWLAENMPESGPATIVHGDYRLGNTMFGHGSPPRLVAIFDWELATIGDPLADVGYLTATWAKRDETATVTIFDLSAVTRAKGFPSRRGLIARYEERSGRSMSAVNWYQALAIWKAAVFMEGNYKRSLAGTTDDPFLALFDEGVPLLAERAWELANGA
jgi:aminoglycoside phosphotransferase (APT) family kinase protein